MSTTKVAPKQGGLPPSGLAGQVVTKIDAADFNADWETAGSGGGSGGGAPSTARFVTTQAEAGLTNEVNLGALTSGILRQDVSGGVASVSIAVRGVDYYAPNYSGALDTISSLSAMHNNVIQSVSGVWGSRSPSQLLATLPDAFIHQDGTKPFTGDQSLGSHKLTNLADPASLQDAVTLAILNNNATGLMATTAGVATTAALPSCTYSNGSSGVGATLTAASNGALVIDGVTMGIRGRILVKDQAAPAQNGLYVMTTVGDGSNAFVLTRAQDMQYDNEFSKRLIFVVSGTSNAGKAWSCTTDTPVIGTDAINFTSFPLGGATANQAIGNITGGFQTNDGSPCAVGSRFRIRCPYAGTITGWAVGADVADTISIEVRKCTQAQYDGGATHPATGDKISASAPPNTSSSTKGASTTLTGWTTSVSAGDWIEMYLSACAAATLIICQLDITKS